MKIIHVSDLHLGLMYHDFSLYEDQKHMLESIIQNISAHKADVLLISGDVYHKHAPSEESFKLWSYFLELLKPLDITTFIISGNHDASGRLGVGASYLEFGNIYLESEYEGHLVTHHIHHQDQDYYFTLLPFIRPSNVRNHHDDFKSTQYHDAMAYVLKDYDDSKPGHHILLAHQFVIDGQKTPELSDSEITPQVGGIDAIHAHLFDGFDYVALGHIHRPQHIRKNTVLYSGSPLKYSKSEANDTKGFVLLECDDSIHIQHVPITPLRDVKVIKGDLKSLIEAAPNPKSQDFIHAIITDATRPINPMEQLQEVYPNAVDIEFQNKTSRASQETLRAEQIIALQPQDLIQQFYTEMLEKELTDEAVELIESVLNQVGEQTNETD